MSIPSVILYGFEVLAGISALGIIFVKNVFHAALLLILCLLSLAGIFVLYNAEFIATTQILIYAGGILVLIIFGIMLTSRITGKPTVVKNQYVLGGTLLSLFFATVLIMLIPEQTFFENPSPAVSQNSINTIGILLMSDYALAFEITGILLLAALLGAVVAASSFDTKKQ